MGAPTSNDRFAFANFSDQQKLNVIKLYLWQGYNMQEVAQQVFPHDSRAIAQNVSVITRCYGFEGQNKGIFRRWGIDRTVTDNDLIAFIKKYRNGCPYDGNGEEMRRFLLQRIQSRNSLAYSGNAKPQFQSSVGTGTKQAMYSGSSESQFQGVAGTSTKQALYSGTSEPQFQPQRESFSSRDFYSSGSGEDTGSLFGGIAVIVVIVLLFIFRKKIWAFIVAAFTKFISWLLGIIPVVIGILVLLWIIGKLISALFDR